MKNRLKKGARGAKKKNPFFPGLPQDTHLGKGGKNQISPPQKTRGPTAGTYLGFAGFFPAPTPGKGGPVFFFL